VYTVRWGIVLDVLPQSRAISWQDHLFGAIGGLLAAWVLCRRRSVSKGPLAAP
jgi:membrane associated rhomboid family serine protease